jgi:hypothetical protein
MAAALMAHPSRLAEDGEHLRMTVVLAGSRKIGRDDFRDQLAEFAGDRMLEEQGRSELDAERFVGL